MFACGLKDADPASADKIEKIIFDTLHSLVENGIDKELVESAIHQIEFYRKEVTNTPYPLWHQTPAALVRGLVSQRGSGFGPGI